MCTYVIQDNGNEMPIKGGIMFILKLSKKCQKCQKNVKKMSCKHDWMDGFKLTFFFFS